MTVWILGIACAALVFLLIAVSLAGGYYKSMYENIDKEYKNLVKSQEQERQRITAESLLTGQSMAYEEIQNDIRKIMRQASGEE